MGQRIDAVADLEHLSDGKRLVVGTAVMPSSLMILDVEVTVHSAAELMQKAEKLGLEMWAIADQSQVTLCVVEEGYGFARDFNHERKAPKDSI